MVKHNLQIATSRLSNKRVVDDTIKEEEVEKESLQTQE